MGYQMHIHVLVCKHAQIIAVAYAQICFRNWLFEFQRTALAYNIYSCVHLSVSYLQDGMTPLYIASWKGHIAVMQLLLQMCADVGTSNMV